MVASAWVQECMRSGCGGVYSAKLGYMTAIVPD